MGDELLERLRRRLCLDCGEPATSIMCHDCSMLRFNERMAQIRAES